MDRLLSVHACFTEKHLILPNNNYLRIMSKTTDSHSLFPFPDLAYPPRSLLPGSASVETEVSRNLHCGVGREF